MFYNKYSILYNFFISDKSKTRSRRHYCLLIQIPGKCSRETKLTNQNFVIGKPKFGNGIANVKHWDSNQAVSLAKSLYLNHSVLIYYSLFVSIYIRFWNVRNCRLFSPILRVALLRSFIFKKLRTRPTQKLRIFLIFLIWIWIKISNTEMPRCDKFFFEGNTLYIFRQVDCIFS